jgi:hypothetical protein
LIKGDFRREALCRFDWRAVVIDEKGAKIPSVVYEALFNASPS